MTQEYIAVATGYSIALYVKPTDGNVAVDTGMYVQYDDSGEFRADRLSKDKAIENMQRIISALEEYNEGDFGKGYEWHD